MSPITTSEFLFSISIPLEVTSPFTFIPPLPVLSINVLFVLFTLAVEFKLTAPAVFRIFIVCASSSLDEFWVILPLMLIPFLTELSIFKVTSVF